jgi:acetyl-CoA decarbonylase/synthase complex subunit epsilon
MAIAEPWQTAEIPGPTKALVITKPEMVVAMIKKAKRPIIIVGHEAAEIRLGKRKPIDYVILMAKATKAPVVATAHIIKEFLERGFQSAASMSAVDIANRLQDSEWDGLDGKGQYDLALFSGIPYSMEWNILSGLKHFAPHLKTICLDRFYQPQASLSFPNISLEEWHSYLKAIVDELEAK